MQKNLLEFEYVPATRLFQRNKAMNANTVIASNGPTMNHCTVVLSGKNEKAIRDCMGQLKTSSYNWLSGTYFGTRNSGPCLNYC